MGTKKTITLDDIYRLLRFHDKEILKHFNDETLNDQMYLFYALNSDIISNAISIVMAMETNNIDSIGVDNCCRTIIEAFTVLKMMAVGDISDEQAKIFRYHYAIVDFDNMRKFTDDKTKELDDFKYVSRDKARAYKAILKFHKCSKADLKKDPDFDDSNFYLKKKLGTRLRFSDLLKKYSILDANIDKVYGFFSLFIHPRYEFDLDIECGLRKIRLSYIHKVLDYVVDYLKDNKLFVFDNSNTFRQDFYENPLLQNNVSNINDMDFIFDTIERKTCYFPDGIDGFTRFFLRTISSIIKDMQISLSLGYKEHIISLFKSAFEYIAVYVCINEFELEEFKKIKLAYCYSSRLQFNCLMEKMELPPLFGDETISGLKEVFENYYKDKYDLDSFESFAESVLHNARYFLNKRNNSFNSIVNKVLDDLYINPFEREYTKMIYKISKDMNHGGGYTFNSSPGLIDSMCRHVLNTIYRFMVEKITVSQITLNEHGYNVDLSLEASVFILLSNLEKDEIEKITKDYFNDKKPS